MAFIRLCQDLVICTIGKYFVPCLLLLLSCAFLSLFLFLPFVYLFALLSQFAYHFFFLPKVLPWVDARLVMLLRQAIVL